MPTQSGSPHSAANVSPKARAKRKPYCQQCKERRVKCDLQQPSCQRCSRRGRRCEYQRSGYNEKLCSDIVSPEALRSAALRRLEECFQYETKTSCSSVKLLNQRSPQHKFRSRTHPTLSDNEESASHIYLPLLPRTDMTACYLNVIHREISTKSTLLLHPHIWAAELSGRCDDDPVLLAAFACGARVLKHHERATILYTHCIRQLRKRLSEFSTADGVLSTTDICATIMLLTVYELRSNPSSLYNFRLHLQGLAQCLRLHIGYYNKLPEHKPIRTMIPKPEPGCSGLLIAIYRGFRNLESVQSIILGAEPLLSRSEYATLFDDGVADMEPAVMTEVWRIMHLVASSYRNTLVEKVSFLSMTEEFLSGMPWYMPDPECQGTAYYRGRPIHEPDNAQFHNAGNSTAWQHIESISANLLVHASLLRLQTSICKMLPDTKQAVLGRAAGVAILCSIMLNQPPSILHGWCLLGLSSVCESYTQLLSESDSRRTRSTNMLHDLCNQFGIPFAALTDESHDVRSC